MSKQIIVASHKGGVNKSTITANLGIGFVQYNSNYKVLMIDTDSQANLSKKFIKEDYRKMKGLTELLKGDDLNKCIHHTSFSNLDIIPCKQQLSVTKKEMLLSMHGFQQQRLIKSLQLIMKEYDLLIFDTAPGLDIMTFNVLQFLNGDGLLLIPIVPDSNKIEESDSIEGMNLLLDELKESISAGENLKPNLRVLATEVDNDLISESFVETTKDFFSSKMLNTTIPFSARNARRKENFVIEKKRTKIAQAYRKLVSELAEVLYE